MKAECAYWQWLFDGMGEVFFNFDISIKNMSPEGRRQKPCDGTEDEPEGERKWINEMEGE